MIQLTPHFTIDEFIESDKADEHGIENMPSAAECDNLMITASRMEIVRKILGGKPIKITSGFRCQELNAIVGGSATSAHTKGMAVDFQCPSFGTPRQICMAIVQAMQAIPLSELPIDQLINEGSWVHIGFRQGSPRFETLTAVFTPGQKTKYKPGIIDA